MSDTGSETTAAEPPQCACPALDAPLDDGIFLLSYQGVALWKYYPKTNSLTKLGGLNCLQGAPWSMAVNRQGVAWVLFENGHMRALDVTKLGTCMSLDFILPPNPPEFLFGMAFVPTGESEPCDQLYANTYNSATGSTEWPDIADFFTVTPDTQKIVNIGKTDFSGAEVTGLPDGRTFLFGGVNPAKLVEIDKATGAEISVLPLDGVEINGGGRAFAFFDGDFYFFTDSDKDFKSEVTRLDYDDSDNNGVQDLEVLMVDAPQIVGAGVVNCAAKPL